MFIILKVLFFIFSFIIFPLNATPTEDLFQAVKKTNITEVNRALDEGADINAGNEWNSTPLMLATHFGALPIVKRRCKWRKSSNEFFR